MPASLHYAMSRAFGLVLALTLASTSALALPTYSDIYTFGDSLSDTGNLASLYPDGDLAPVAATVGYGPNDRFSNGPLWHEYLADTLSVARASHSNGGGNSYAHAGAQVNDAVGLSAGMLTQHAQYNSASGGISDPDALYIAWAGGNDLLALAGDVNPLLAIEARLDALLGMLTGLVDSGANTLLVPNLPDLGSIPQLAGSANAPIATALTTYWNTGLEQRLLDLGTNNSASIFYFDVFGLFNSILANPAAAGFSNTTEGCRYVEEAGPGNLPTEFSCAGADSYLFWDQMHPTTAAHQLLGSSAFELLASGQAIGGPGQVPAPLTLWLLLSGLVLLAWTGRGGIRHRL
ncbi:SGNH/GDSL hydrolase family protein [Kineobactrum salinum]|uniref:SGNH/GDSL hydrolase family protein n=1 Tax=Kineobactrum salinum TaxID=2708301 RepID=A0A6C0U2U2_9GAMM|nr:SGNH/GDSL hydrolase family protein [Kineobactrum salinum]QIB64685.1 SGNH/GDSL hydrolase family protein [Kineobactrum salinum]